MKDICLELKNNPEKLALVGEILGAASINIEGLCFTANDDLAVVHCVVEDAVTARRVLEDEGIKVKDVTDVFILSKDRKRITGKSGSFGNICRTLADNGIGIRFGYPAENNQFVFGVDDIEKARKLLE
ncbi:MAG: amino acid-binding ACT domain-containing protein [Bacteroidetes bacterium]|jgi:hypothetical protein|nr:amino acid-binding ACT domain-containing protein [Bacteroidota bacterium]